MSTIYPMKCRYSDDCGTFPNGVMLRFHYDNNHPDYVPTTKRGECSGCGQSLSRASFLGHVRSMHNGNPELTFVREGGTPANRRDNRNGLTVGNCTVCDLPIKRKNISRHVVEVHKVALEWGQGVDYWRPSSNVVEIRPVEQQQQLSMAHHPSVVEQHEPSSDLEPLTADSIVIGAIEAMAYPGNSVPVASMAALFLWRDQTAAMIASVTGQAQ